MFLVEHFRSKPSAPAFSKTPNRHSIGNNRSPNSNPGMFHVEQFRALPTSSETQIVPRGTILSFPAIQPGPEPPGIVI
jgi:hypothetical protein